MNTVLADTEMNPAYYAGHELGALEQARNYYEWLLSEFRPAMHGTILEIGAGTGTISEKLRANSEHLVCLEPAANLVPVLQRRLGSDDGCEIKIVGETFEHYSQDAGDHSFDTIVCINVLEHIADDLHSVREMQRLLRPGGKLCLFVPAMPLIYGTMDAEFGHYRRYTKRRLKEMMATAGLKITTLKHFNLPGSFAWFLTGRVLRWKSCDESPVKWYDQVVVPVTRSIESVISPPFGQSLLLIAEAQGDKPANS